MTSLTQAAALSPDPVMRAAEIKAMRDDIASMRKRGRMARSGASTHGIGSEQRRIANEAADDLFKDADRLQRCLDELTSNAP